MARLFAFLCLFSTALPSAAQADPVSEIVRLDMISVRNFIFAHCDEWKALREGGVDAAQLRSKIDEVGLGEKFLTEENVALADGVLRSGRFRKDVPDVTFSTAFWKAADADAVRKIGIEVHEYLGLLGVEITDDYHVSSAVVNELRQISFAGALSKISRYEPAANIGSDACPDLSGVWILDPRANIGTLIYQQGCARLTIREIIVKSAKDFIFNYGIQESPVVSVVGGSHERVENGMFNDLPMDFPVKYTAAFQGKEFVENQERPRALHGCHARTVKWTLEHDTLVKDQVTHCAGGKTQKEHDVYQRAH